MATEQSFQDVPQHEVDGDRSSLQKWKSVSDAAITADTATGCFDCNICLDYAQEPVVTLCGHLYCWPCIYKWLHFQGTSTGPEEEEQKQQCPVCKANVSHTTLIPLYVGSQAPEQTQSKGKAPQPGLQIPSRPSASGVHALITTITSTESPPSRQPHRNSYRSRSPAYPPQQQYYSHQYRNYATPTSASSSPMFNLRETTMSTNVIHPIVGMFGEMVYARAFGNSGASLDLYSYPNSYYLTGSTSPRIRRLEKQADKSLSRVSFFLFCCLVLCLLLF